MKHLTFITLMLITLPVFSAAPAPLRAMRRTANNVIATINTALQKPTTPAQQIIGTSMALGGVYAMAAKNRNLQGIVLMIAGTIMATGNVQNACSFAQQRYDSIKLSLEQEQKQASKKTV